METEKHRRQSVVLTESLELALADRDDVYVGANMFVYFSELQIKKNDFRGPDVFVVLNTNRRVRKSWVVWQENDRKPDVVIELVSETTEDVDRGDKMRIYAKMMRVTNYYIFDPLSLQFDGYVLDPQRGEYVPLQPDAQGNLVCPPLGLRLGVRRAQVQGIDDEWLRWIDPQGNMLPTPEEQARLAGEQARLAGEQARLAGEQARSATQQARVAEDRAQREASLRVDAELRLANALAELERLKAAR